ncbi:hypothetical protein C2S53_001842 [Perilla frutescens var. hirtella]|uniref:TF-B3 domain-containing protein n=1 Tax=Perilla frutescens var. hirtella TaxID=608512 RepID=A0AAD4J4X3_PERFH|nr:hypothetical protein C2S53_001842 [Perilla frutescens var. hirtella]
MAKETQSQARKALFSHINLSSEKCRHVAQTSPMVNFSALCKTWEYKYRMNLPKEVINTCGKETCYIEIEIGYTGIRTDVIYQYREIKANKPNCRLIGGWKHIVEFLQIQQGDELYFEGKSDKPSLLRVSRDKHGDAVKVDDEYWI